ncbi:dihydrodipicolinate synthase family protein [Mesorhizobium sp. WSM4887]|uniref:dihydrodipicolinate synthase family protein n=1 Tax=Mesorhizobium sp. WSM4887 TaxID=3038543 RepID=UPI0024180EFA|nr:dihydrodipicolinate synthase family protein [Mesorhizobium sp. WSM4887]MDG4889763.1 dihydrodipicolinate synthase family protein [Mesorhizobium sp. WSM4887]
MKRKPALFVPTITPFKADLSVDLERYVENCRLVLSEGAHGLAPFGTTGEANSLSVGERMEALDALISGGVAPSKLIPGTGCAALPDSITLTRHAVSKGCLGTLMLPPFYYKGVSEEGLFASYARIVEAVGDVRLKIYLYHIPQMTGLPVTLSLIERLLRSYPTVFIGMKDSSGDWENTHTVIKTFPELLIYSSSEALIPKNVDAGGAGCISASANVNSRGIVALMRALGTGEEEAIAARVGEIRKIFEGLPLVPAIKAVAAKLRGDAAYAVVRPPFVPLAQNHVAEIERAAALCTAI